MNRKGKERREGTAPSRSRMPCRTVSGGGGRGMIFPNWWTTWHSILYVETSGYKLPIDGVMPPVQRTPIADSQFRHPRVSLPSSLFQRQQRASARPSMLPSPLAQPPVSPMPLRRLCPHISPPGHIVCGPLWLLVPLAPPPAHCFSRPPRPSQKAQSTTAGPGPSRRGTWPLMPGPSAKSRSTRNASMCWVPPATGTTRCCWCSRSCGSLSGIGPIQAGCQEVRSEREREREIDRERERERERELPTKAVGIRKARGFVRVTRAALSTLPNVPIPRKREATE